MNIITVHPINDIPSKYVNICNHNDNTPNEPNISNATLNVYYL
jgi:hypothetical protein